MSQATSDFYGPTGSTFTLAISSGSLYQANLHVMGQDPQNDKAQTVSGDHLQVTVTGLPAGDSELQLLMGAWQPGDPNATVSLVPGGSGGMAATGPNPTIDDGNWLGIVNLFGT